MAYHRSLVLALTGPVAVLAGCASITGSSEQPITVLAVCEGETVQAASCELNNDKGKWLVQTPGSAIVRKSYGDLKVSCSKLDSSGSAVFVSKNNGGVWGNALAGGLIGYAIDSSNGAGFNYPEQVVVVLGSPCP